MKPKIGVFGSGAGELAHLFSYATRIGNALAKHTVTVITGGGSGIPYQVAEEAHKNGSEVWAFSPFTTLKDHQKVYPDTDPAIYSRIVFVPKEFEFNGDKEICRKYRNVTSTATCDAGIIISGRWGTLNEFTNLVDMGKVIGVVTETGGIADEIEYLGKKIKKEGKAKIIFNSSPEKLVEDVILTLQK